MPSTSFAAGTGCCLGTGRVWGSAEVLFWRIKAGGVPPLVTTGTPDSGGTLGAPGTTTLVGDSLGYGTRAGGRFAAGGWLGCDCRLGVEGGYFFLGGGGNGTSSTSSGADGSAVLGRPFFNVVSGVQDVEVVALPGVAGGTVRTSSGSNLQGADLNLLWNACCQPVCCPTDCCPTDCGPTACSNAIAFRWYAFAGPRWLQLRENVVVAERVETDPASAFVVVDRFDTRNTFFGGQLGARAELQRGRWFVNLLGKVAIGDTRQEVRISGTTVITQADAAPVVQPGGLLAQPTNSGTHTRDRFAVVPEVNFNVGFQATPYLRVFAGYTFLYWSSVVRPGDQIDSGVNPTQLASAAGPGQLVGPARPAFAFRTTDFWAQGVNLGIQLRW